MTDNIKNINTPEQGSGDEVYTDEETIDKVNLSYDGSNVISSEPYTMAFNSSDEANYKTVELSEEQESNNDIKKNNNTELENKNKELTEQIIKYEALLNQLLSLNTSKSLANGKTDSSDEMLNKNSDEIYKKGKQDAIIETIRKIETDKQFDEKVQQIRMKNPDIAFDPDKEEIVGLLAGKYISQGYDFDNSVDKAIKDLRKLTNTQDLKDKKDTNKMKSHNIPHNVQYKKQVSPANLHIEGRSQAIPERHFKSSELIKMQIHQPDEYLRLQPQIMKAYVEGRVIFD
ncbi:MAG: hypothetical protein AB1782_09055 [Cyanobacteriota bacterium]